MVYNDLDKTSYKYKFDEFIFYFSSELYLNKFVKMIPSYLRDESIKLSIKYNNIISIDALLLLSLYKKIEKRGYKVTYKGKHLNDKCYFTLNIDDSSFIE